MPQTNVVLDEGLDLFNFVVAKGFRFVTVQQIAAVLGWQEPRIRRVLRSYEAKSILEETPAGWRLSISFLGIIGTYAAAIRSQLAEQEEYLEIVERVKTLISVEKDAARPSAETPI